MEEEQSLEEEEASEEEEAFEEKQEEQEKQPFEEEKSFTEWLSSLEAAPKPMFLCIAANGYSFNCKPPPPVQNRNDTSAFFVIAWPGSGKQLTPDTFVYYAAGDGNLKVEGYFASKAYLDLNASGKRILVAKGTHHGGLSAFNEKLFWQMKPMNYIVSAGNQHGHPSKSIDSIYERSLRLST